MAIITDIFNDGSYWVWVKCGFRQDKYYESLKYKVPKVKDKSGRIRSIKGLEILVRIEHLPNRSHALITKVCDECDKKTVNLSYKTILLQRGKGDGVDRCTKCAGTKRAEVKKANVPLENSISYKFPLLVKQWHPINNGSITPDKVYAHSNEIFWWVCPSNPDHEYDMSANERTSQGCNCPYCSGYRVNHTNCLWTLEKETAKLLLNPEDGYKYTRNSGKRLDWKCLDCDNIIKNRSIYHIVNFGLSCSRCSDGFSYPEKFMSGFLTQLNVEYETQKSFEWSKNVEHKNNKLCGYKKYDFYVIVFNYIIETHGAQHYVRITGRLSDKTLEEEQENDLLKQLLAHKNGIEHYIAIDCFKSELEYIKNNILNSKLSSLFDLSNINWNKCHEYACNSLVKSVCELWSSGTKNSKQICEILKISKPTAIRYLKQGVTLGWCDYNPELLKNKGSLPKSVVRLNTDEQYIDEYESSSDAGKQLSISCNSIKFVCNGTQKMAGGFKWMYKKDYERHMAALKSKNNGMLLK